MTASKDIVFFLCLNDRGGAEISMLRLAEGLRQKGREVSLAVYGAQPELAAEFGFRGDITNLKCRRTLEALFPLVALLRLRRPAFVISALTHTNLIALMAGCLTDTRVIVTEHGVDGIAAFGFFARLLRFLYSRAYAVVAVSQALAKCWRGMLPARAKVISIYNPVVEPRETLPPAHEWLRDKKLPVVIGIGRLKPEKNFVLLLRAFAAMAKEKPARLIILGEGEERAMLENLVRKLGVADYVMMPGFTDIRAWLAYSDLLVCSSKREGFGNVIVEALACGVSVVASDCDGPDEILQQGRYGDLVPVDDVAATADAMRASLEKLADRQALIARAADFTVQRCIDAYADLLDNSAGS